MFLICSMYWGISVTLHAMWSDQNISGLINEWMVSVFPSVVDRGKYDETLQMVGRDNIPLETFQIRKRKFPLQTMHNPNVKIRWMIWIMKFAICTIMLQWHLFVLVYGWKGKFVVLTTFSSLAALDDYNPRCNQWWKSREHDDLFISGVHITDFVFCL